MIFTILSIFLIWVAGSYHMWRRQTSSVEFVSVTIFDRVIALFWPFIYLILFLTIILHRFTGRDRRVQPPGE